MRTDVLLGREMFRSFQNNDISYLEVILANIFFFFFFDQEPEGFRDSALEIPTLNSFLSVSLGTLISLKSGRRSLEEFGA